MVPDALDPDATDKPAESVDADNTAGTGDQVGTGNTDGAFEPGPSSPFDEQGSLRWSAARARERWEAQRYKDADRERMKRWAEAGW